MLNKLIAFLVIFTFHCHSFGATKDLSMPPPLYKIVSQEAWDTKPVDSKSVPLTLFDTTFIHLSTEEQLPRIFEKFWKGKAVVVLKLDPSQLEGDLRYEVNPGGANKYYHLYDGRIPLDAVVENPVKKKVD